MGLRLVTFPDRDDILDFLPLKKMKDSLRISYTKEDEFIKDCIVAAYDHMAGEHGWLNRSILPTKWVLTGNTFANPIQIPKPPYLRDAILSYRSGGVIVPAVVDSMYYLDPYGDYGYGYVSPVSTWPAVDKHPAAVNLEFWGGYGTDAEDIAEAHPALQSAMMILAADYFRHREDTFVDIRMVEINRSVVNNAKVRAGRYKLYNSVW